MQAREKRWYRVRSSIGLINLERPRSVEIHARLRDLTRQVIMMIVKSLSLKVLTSA